jgi:hypothetical protein
MPSKLSTWASTMSWASVVVAACGTALFWANVADGNYVWSAFAFAMMAALADIGVLLLAMIPAGIAYFRTRQRGDRLCLWLAAASFLVILGEAFLLNVVLPMRGE